MGRLLGLVLLAFLIWLCLRAVRRFLQAPESPQDARRSMPVETLVRCAACGVYVSGERTLPGERGGAYCSEACRLQAAAATPSS